MGKVIHTDSPAKRRDKTMRLLSSLFKNSNFNDYYDPDFRDKIAFIFLSLKSIEKTVAETVAPWEKRDYWLKADKFRSDWSWVGQISSSILEKTKKNGWNEMGEEIDFLKKALADIEPLKRLSNSKFWDGAYTAFKKL